MNCFCLTATARWLLTIFCLCVCLCSRCNNNHFMHPSVRGVNNKSIKLIVMCENNHKIRSLFRISFFSLSVWIIQMEKSSMQFFINRIDYFNDKSSLTTRWAGRKEIQSHGKWIFAVVNNIQNQIVIIFGFSRYVFLGTPIIYLFVFTKILLVRVRLIEAKRNIIQMIPFTRCKTRNNKHPEKSCLLMQRKMETTKLITAKCSKQLNWIKKICSHKEPRCNE